MPITPSIIKSIESLIEIEKSRVANMANISALLMAEANYHWVGFYTVDEENDELVLGPFQGPIACTRLRHGLGVCAKAWDDAKTVVVPDVHKFEGHVACSSRSNSELVIPVKNDGKVVAVLDIDSVEFNAFTREEIKVLEKIVSKLEDRWEG